jgi:hypothetical protein
MNTPLRRRISQPPNQFKSRSHSHYLQSIQISAPDEELVMNQPDSMRKEEDSCQRLPHGREVLATWDWLGKAHRVPLKHYLKQFAFALLVHGSLGLWMYFFQPRVKNLVSGSSTIQVRFASPKTVGIPKKPPGTKGSVPHFLPKTKTDPGRSKPKATLTTPSKSPHSVAQAPERFPISPKVDSPNVPNLPEVSLPSTDVAPAPDGAGDTPATHNQEGSEVGPSLLPSSLRDLLPGSSASYKNRQQYIGQVIGEGPVGGDISPTTTPDPTQVIQETVFSTAAYFDGISRSFGEAWGPVRTLPRDAFYGKVGEKIEYDIIINRDGTLRKIINISARKEPHRNFKAVDKLVNEVFASVFPFNPIPDRVVVTPLVLRKVIVYQGDMARIF